jgi:AcrR family transcriptional regulator
MVMNQGDQKKTKGQKTQDIIIEKALELFGTNGFANTSMQMIAKSCDLSQGAVMQHFRSKKGLLEGIRKYVNRSNHEYVDSRILPTDDGVVSIIKHLENNLEWALKNRAEANIIYLVYETGIYDSEYREIATTSARFATDRIYRYILSAQREKLISISEDPEFYAELIHEYILGMIFRTISRSEAGRRTQPMSQRIEFFVRNLLHADLTPKKKSK